VATTADAQAREKKVLQTGETADRQADDSMDLLERVEVETLVVEALKSETTLQQAPAIVSVLTGRQIREQGYRFAGDAMAAVPGFLPRRWMWNTDIAGNNSRGLFAGALYLMDGHDMSDATQCMANFGDALPIEMIKNIEVISGPGGVLWGANSFLGVVNIVTRTADDLDGVEASFGWGTGPGRPSDYRAYVMGGQKLWKDRIKLLLHASYETFYAPELDFPFNASVGRYSSPYPPGPVLMSGPMTTQTPRDHWVILSGNAQLGPISAHFHLPLFLGGGNPANFTGAGMRYDLGEDSIDCTDPANRAICQLRVDPNRVGRRFSGAYYQSYASLRYRERMLNDRLRLDARVGYMHQFGEFNPYTSIIPSSVFSSGVVVEQPMTSDRVGGSIDATILLPWKLRLLTGGELNYDYMAQNRANFRTDPAVIETRLPYVCPEYYGQYIEGKTCPIITNYETNRLTGGFFVQLQRSILRNLSVDLGGRVQASTLKRPLDPVVLASGGVVWGFVPNWNLKLAYGEGYRPPPLHRTDANGEAINWGGNPDIKVERSRAAQGEINAVLLKGYRSISQLAFRVDYAYTWVTDLINVLNGTYSNVSDIGIHSAEFLADLDLRTGHSFGLSYTFLDMADTQRGKIRTVPNQWLTARVLLNLWNRQLYLSSNLHIRGSAEDPNKYPAIPSSPVYLGDVDANGRPVQVPTWTARVTDITMDRMPPVAIWNAGLRYRFKKPHLLLAFDAYNILNGQFWDSETGYDQSAYLEFTPSPFEKFSFFTSATYSYQ
jgi:outer membrane receptor protein involved in Fe transport